MDFEIAWGAILLVSGFGAAVGSAITALIMSRRGSQALANERQLREAQQRQVRS